MKIILTGATGFVGSETLSRLVANPRIEHVTCLVQREMAAHSPKVTAIVVSDFESYDDALLERLEDHGACIWTLGGKASNFASVDAYARVTNHYTLALAGAMARRTQARHRFSFCYLSGMGAARSEKVRLPWERLTRQLKGRTERDLFDLQVRFPHVSTHSFRPGGILPVTGKDITRKLLAPITVDVRAVAEAMIVGAIDPKLFRQLPVVGNGRIKQLGVQAVPSASRA